MIQSRVFVSSAVVLCLLLGGGCSRQMGTDVAGPTTPVAPEAKTIAEPSSPPPTATPTPSSSEREQKIRLHRERIRQIIQVNREMENPATLAAILKKVAVDENYSLGKIAQASLGEDQALRLDCAENPYSIKRFVVYHRGTNDCFFVYAVYTNDSFDAHWTPLSALGPLEFSPKQDPSVRVYLKWKSAAGGLDVWFEAKANREFGKAFAQLVTSVQPEMRQTLEEGPKDESPQERADRLQTMAEKRHEVEMSLKKKVEELKKEYNMGADW